MFFSLSLEVPAERTCPTLHDSMVFTAASTLRFLPGSLVSPSLQAPRGTLRQAFQARMSSTSLPSELPSLIARQSKAALEHGSAFFYPSEIHTIEDNASDADVPLQWSVRRCEALREKAREKKRKEEAQGQVKAEPTAPQGGQNPADVFAPPYDRHCE